MAPQSAAPASAGRPLQHTLVAPSVQAQPLKAAGRTPARPAALRWGGLTAAPPPPLPPLGRRLEDAAAPGGLPAFSAAPSGLVAHQQQPAGGAASNSAPRLPPASLIRQRRRQRLVRAAGVAAPAAAAGAPAAAGSGADAQNAEQRRAARWEAMARWLEDGSSAAALDFGQDRQEDDALRGLLPRRRQAGRLSAEEEQELARVVAAGGPRAEGAAAQLAGANVALVHHLARRFDGRGLSRDDVVGEGLGALARAARRYRPGTDARFATFATPVIWQAMQKALHGQSRSVRLPAHHHTDMRRVRAASEQLAAELGHAPRLEAVAHRCDLSVEYTAHLVKQMKQGEGRARLPPLRQPSSRGAPPEPLGPDDESDDAAEVEEHRVHEAAVEREVEALLDSLAQESEKLARVVRLRHRLGEAGAGEVGGTGRLRPFKEVGQALGCTGAHASSLYKQAKIKMESLSQRAAGRAASQPGTRRHLQQQLAAAGRDGRLAAAVSRLSEERQLLLALRCGWFETPWLQGRGRPTFKALAELWGRNACWASNNCTIGAKELRQMLLPFAEDSFKLLHALETQKEPPHCPAQLLQRWDALTRQLPGSQLTNADAELPQIAQPQTVPSMEHSVPSVAGSTMPAAVPAASPAEMAAYAAPAAAPSSSSSAADNAPWPAVPCADGSSAAGASSVVPFRLRRATGPQLDGSNQFDEAAELYSLLARLSEMQSQQRALAGAR